MRLSRRVTQLAESATLAVSAAAARLKAEGVDVVGFGAGEPDFDTPDHIKAAAIDAINAGHTKYAKPASGSPQAKTAICHKFKTENNLDYAPEQVIVTSGGKMALALIMQAMLDVGDEVVIPKPYWVSYPEMAKMAGGKPVFLSGPADYDFKLRPEDLDAVITDRTRIVILNSPSNPSGVTYHPAEIEALVPVLQDRDILVISDEIYDRLLYDGQQTISYASINPKTYAQTITVNSASKTYAMTGWRLAYAGGPVDLIKAMGKIQTQTTSGAVTFNHHALVAALTSDQSPVENMRKEFEVRARHMWERLTALPGVTCPRPTGAFYCFPNVSQTYDRLGVAGSVAFATRLLEKAAVAVVPGAAFGMDGNIRLSFATSMEQIDKGLDRMRDFLS
ncbi:MAG: pyridoxal phosphate-dependent aminotransferase [Planctomycetota bacterium]|jgi:aspartate aminotransferase